MLRGNGGRKGTKSDRNGRASKEAAAEKRRGGRGGSGTVQDDVGGVCRDREREGTGRRADGKEVGEGAFVQDKGRTRSTGPRAGNAERDATYEVGRNRLRGEQRGRSRGFWPTAAAVESRFIQSDSCWGQRDGQGGGGRQNGGGKAAGWTEERWLAVTVRGSWTRLG